MENNDIYAQRSINKSILVGGILCFAVASSTTSNNGMHWYELSFIQITREKRVVFDILRNSFIHSMFV